MTNERGLAHVEGAEPKDASEHQARDEARLAAGLDEAHHPSHPHQRRRNQSHPLSTAHLIS